MHQPVISMRVGSCTFSSHLSWTAVWMQSSQRLAIFGHLLPKQSIFRHASAEILPKILRNLFIIVSARRILSVQGVAKKFPPAPYFPRLCICPPLLRHWFNLPVPEQSRYDVIRLLIAYNKSYVLYRREERSNEIITKAHQHIQWSLLNFEAHCNECVTSVDCRLRFYF